MSRESDFRRVFKWAGPPSIRRRLRRASLYAVAALSLFVPLLGIFIHLAAPQDSHLILSWRLGVSLWLLSVLMIPVYLFASGRVERAMTAYLLVTLAVYPVALAILDGALRLSFGILGAGTTLVIGLGLVLGFASLPLVVRSRRRNYQAALAGGHFKDSLDPETGRWNPGFDFAYLDDKKWLNRPGCLLRLLPWAGPAIGIYLADIVGRSAANVFIAVGFLVVGYGMMYAGLAQAFTQFLEFRRLEKELGRPIMLAEEPAAS